MFFFTEFPRVGATELWELIDITPDSHPIHIHLIQFQIVNRQPADVDAYTKAWAAAFPGGTFAGQNCDGTAGMVDYAPGEIIPGYGWHCHILDHEDNEMMRPYTPIR